VFTIEIPHKGLVFSNRFPWRIGIVSFMVFPDMAAGKGDITKNIKTILQDPFFDGIEICGLTEEQWTAAKSFMGSKTAARCMQPDLLSGKFNLHSNNSDVRRSAVELVKKGIDLSSKWGIRNVAICSGPDPGPGRRTEEKSLLAESLNEICGHAAKKDVRILIETFDREWDKKLLIGPMADCLDVVKEVRRKYSNLGIMWDLSHGPLLGETPDVLDTAKDFLGHIHIGCAKRIGEKYLDTHPVFYSEGAVNGVKEVASLLKKLIEIDYSGMVSFEVKPEEGQTAESIVTTSKGVLISAYSNVVSEIISG